MNYYSKYSQTSAVLVKSISIVHHGYAVSARVTQSHLAFCSLYTLGHRTTWALLPWSTAALSWLGPAQRILNIKVGLLAEISVGATSCNLIKKGRKSQLSDLTRPQLVLPSLSLLSLRVFRLFPLDTDICIFASLQSSTAIIIRTSPRKGPALSFLWNSQFPGQFYYKTF